MHVWHTCTRAPSERTDLSVAQAHGTTPGRHRHNHSVPAVHGGGAWNPPDEDGDDGIWTAGYGVAELERCEERPDAMPLDQLVRHATVQARLAKGSCARKFGRLRSVKSATVQTDVKQRDYIGARAHTNNTGELSAVHHALLNELSRPPGAGKEVIWSDSLYTINMTTGRWLPKCKRNRILTTTQ